MGDKAVHLWCRVTKNAPWTRVSSTPVSAREIQSVVDAANMSARLVGSSEQRAVFTVGHDPNG